MRGLFLGVLLLFTGCADVDGGGAPLPPPPRELESGVPTSGAPKVDGSSDACPSKTTGGQRRFTCSLSQDGVVLSTFQLLDDRGQLMPDLRQLRVAAGPKLMLSLSMGEKVVFDPIERRSAYIYRLGLSKSERVPRLMGNPEGSALILLDEARKYYAITYGEVSIPDGEGMPLAPFSVALAYDERVFQFRCWIP